MNSPGGALLVGDVVAPLKANQSALPSAPTSPLAAGGGGSVQGRAPKLDRPACRTHRPRACHELSARPTQSPTRVRMTWLRAFGEEQRRCDHQMQAPPDHRIATEASVSTIAIEMDEARAR
jgi:hypothetical protein